MESGLIERPKGDAPLTAMDVRAQVNLIQSVMKEVMQRDVHYGVVPGCGDKPTLLKPGAEKLGMTFGLVPSYVIERYDLPGGHREYELTCKLTTRSGTPVGEGVGVCTTMEGKYRFRSENTGKLVPKEYWETRDQDILGGDSFKARKVDKTWYIYQQVEHTNPADYYNTVKKIGKKRALVDAILSTTAASDIFTQDIEEMGEQEAAHQAPKQVHPTEKAMTPPPVGQQQVDPPAPDDVPQVPPEAKPLPETRAFDGPQPSELKIPAGWPEWKMQPISEPQRKRLFALQKAANKTDEQVKAIIGKRGYTSTGDILRGHYEEISEEVLPGSSAKKEGGR